MYRKLILLIPFLLLVENLISQTKITWQTLGDVTFTDKYYEKEGGYYQFPHFGEKVKALEGKEVYLKGYILTIDPETNYYLLSMNPYAACFFCGNAGPETVVELMFKKPSSTLKMDETVTVRGKLKLNDENLYQCNYIFEEAALYNP